MIHQIVIKEKHFFVSCYYCKEDLSLGDGLSGIGNFKAHIGTDRHVTKRTVALGLEVPADFVALKVIGKQRDAYQSCKNRNIFCKVCSYMFIRMANEKKLMKNIENHDNSKDHCSKRKSVANVHRIDDLFHQTKKAKLN